MGFKPKTKQIQTRYTVEEMKKVKKAASKTEKKPSTFSREVTLKEAENIISKIEGRQD